MKILLLIISLMFFLCSYSQISNSETNIRAGNKNTKISKYSMPNKYGMVEVSDNKKKFTKKYYLNPKTKKTDLYVIAFDDSTYERRYMDTAMKNWTAVWMYNSWKRKEKDGSITIATYMKPYPPLNKNALVFRNYKNFKKLN